jgi:hypothetical protein
MSQQHIVMWQGIKSTTMVATIGKNGMKKTRQASVMNHAMKAPITIPTKNWTPFKKKQIVSRLVAASGCEVLLFDLCG